jgi:hypothetical protein
MGDMRMRRVSLEALLMERRALEKLEEEWPRMNRSTVDKGLRNSIYTRINELRASVAAMETQLRKMKLLETG